MKRSDITTYQVIKACYKFHKEGDDRSPWEILLKETNAPVKVIYAAMLRDESNGYIECGVSVRTAWPTDKGLEYLNRTK